MKNCEWEKMKAYFMLIFPNFATCVGGCFKNLDYIKQGMQSY